MKTRLTLSLAATGAMVAALALPAAAYASSAPAVVEPHTLTNCQAFISGPIVNPNPPNQDLGYLVYGVCSGSGSYYVTVTCPDGSVHNGQTVTVPTDVSGADHSISGCPTLPLQSNVHVVVVSQG